MTSEKKKELFYHLLYFLDNNERNHKYNESHVGAYLQFQSGGRKVITDDDFVAIGYLLQAQRMKELVIRGLVEEMAEWWSGGNGWSIPLSHEIYMAPLDRTDPPDPMWERTLLNLKKKIEKIGFLEFLIRFPGIPEKQRNGYFVRLETDIDKQLANSIKTQENSST